MIFRNKTKFLMYKTLTSFNKTHDMQKTQDIIISKYSLKDNDFAFIISQCVDNHFIDGIFYDKSANNRFMTIYKKYMYITYNGYEFVKNYYSFILKLLRDLLLILATALVTVNVNNWLSTEQTSNPNSYTNTNK